MTASSKVMSNEPLVVLLDVSDPPGGRSWLLVAEAVVAVARLRTRVDRRVCCTVVGATPAELSTGLLAAADVWAGELRGLPERIDPWLGEQLVAPLLAAAAKTVAETQDAADPDPADKLYRNEERTATTAVVAAVAALLSAPIVHAEEVLASGSAGPWGRWARREVSGRPRYPRPRTSAADCAAIEAAVDEALAGAAPGEIVAARSDDPEGAALAAARAELATEAPVHPSAFPMIPVVSPPRPHRFAEVVERQQRAAWDGTVKWGNTWTLELTRRLHDYLKLTDDYQVLTTVSGTAALRMAYEVAVPAAVPGDVAVVPSFTFAATGESLRQLGFRLRFVDVDPVTWTMDPDRLREALADGRPRMVVVVDSLGAPAAHDAIAEIAHDHGVPVVSDSAPSLGSLYRGQPVGMQQAAHAYSMSFAKTVSAGGAGGALVLPADVAVSQGRNWWRSSSMVEMHAVFALDQLNRVEDLVARRQLVADVYDEVIGAHGVRRQRVAAGDRHSWVHYVVQLGSSTARERVARGLEGRGVQTKPYYAPVLHDRCWRDTFAVADASDSPDNLPVTEVLAATTLALPMSSELRGCEVEQVAAALDVVLREEG